jgi:toxin ParE1/3/4
MKLIFSPASERDLEEIGDYIARDNPERAISFLNELQELCNRISEMPSAFPKRDDIEPGLKMGVHGNYLILFHTERDTVRIERIVHGARRLQDLI